MIVLPRDKLVIITPPHTASRALHMALCSAPHGGIWVIGRTGDALHYDHHVACLSPDWTSYQVAVVVRNPFARISGLWRHFNWWRSSRGRPILTLRQFLCSRPPSPDFYWLYHWTISELVGPQAIDDVLRFESIGDDVCRLLGRTVELPRDTVGPLCDYLSLWQSDGATSQLARELHGADFERFGYPTAVEKAFE